MVTTRIWWAHPMRCCLVAIVATTILCATADMVPAQVVTPRREQVIGADNDVRALLTHVPREAVALADSIVAVAQPIDAHIKIFRTDGTSQARFGRQGQGPGEFASMLRIGRVASSREFWAHDPRTQRLTVFDYSARLRREFPLQAFGLAECLGVVGGDTLVLLRTKPGRLNAEIVALAASRPSDVRQLVTFEAWRRSVRVKIPGVGEFAATSPLNDNVLFMFSAEMRALLLIERRVARSADQDSFSVSIVRPNGTRVQRWFPYSPVRANERAIANAIGELERRALAVPGTGLAQYPRARLTAAIRDSLVIPPYLPPVSEALIGVDGRVWVRREATSATARWEVISSDLQRVEARFELPSTSHGRAAGRGVIWVLEHDEFDVPLIVRYRIPGLSGGNLDASQTDSEVHFGLLAGMTEP